MSGGRSIKNTQFCDHKHSWRCRGVSFKLPSDATLTKCETLRWANKHVMWMYDTYKWKCISRLQKKLLTFHSCDWPTNPFEQGENHLHTSVIMFAQTGWKIMLLLIKNNVGINHCFPHTITVSRVYLEHSEKNVPMIQGIKASTFVFLRIFVKESPGINVLRWSLGWDRQQCHAKYENIRAAVDCKADWITSGLHDRMLDCWAFYIWSNMGGMHSLLFMHVSLPEKW